MKNKNHLFSQKTGNQPSKNLVQQFVDNNFDLEGSEFEDWEPKDWNAHIDLFDKITVSFALKSTIFKIVLLFYYL